MPHTRTYQAAVGEVAKLQEMLAAKVQGGVEWGLHGHTYFLPEGLRLSSSRTNILKNTCNTIPGINSSSPTPIHTFILT